MNRRAMFFWRLVSGRACLSTEEVQLRLGCSSGLLVGARQPPGISSFRMDQMKTSKFSWFQWRIGAGADPAMTHVLRQRTRGKEQAVHGCSDAEDWLDCEVWATFAVCGAVQVEHVNLVETMSLLKFLGREMVPICGQVGCIPKGCVVESRPTISHPQLKRDLYPAENTKYRCHGLTCKRETEVLSVSTWCLVFPPRKVGWGAPQISALCVGRRTREE